jgi:hypothetical protein
LPGIGSPCCFAVIARSEATKQSSLTALPLDCFASLAMTGPLYGRARDSHSDQKLRQILNNMV